MLLYVGEISGRHSRGDNGMVVGNLAVIYRVAIQLLGQWFANLAKEVGNFLKNIFTDVSATRTGVGSELLLIKRLCEGEGLIC